MNRRAKEIGAVNSNFENPHGLDSENHYTTAMDLALISSEALKNETFSRISSTYKHSFLIGEKPRTVVNHNKLLKQYVGCIGVKTGYTKKCGRCLVSAAKRGRITLICVTLSDPSDWKDHKTLLDSGFEALEENDVLSKIDIPGKLPVVSGNKEFVSIGIKEDDRWFISAKSSSDAEYDVQLAPYIAKNLFKGDSVGKIIIKSDNSIKEIDIIALEDVKIKDKKLHFFAK